ncbi:MAG: hypothetical protein V2A63_02490 [Patescibacteria group bacterium]
MRPNKVIAKVEKIVRSKIWLTADGREFYLPVELWPNAQVGEQIEFDARIATDDARAMLEAIIN